MLLEMASRWDISASIQRRPSPSPSTDSINVCLHLHQHPSTHFLRNYKNEALRTYSDHHRHAKLATTPLQVFFFAFAMYQLEAYIIRSAYKPPLQAVSTLDVSGFYAGFQYPWTLTRSKGRSPHFWVLKATRGIARGFQDRPSPSVPFSYGSLDAIIMGIIMGILMGHRKPPERAWELVWMTVVKLRSRKDSMMAIVGKGSGGARARRKAGAIANADTTECNHGPNIHPTSRTSDLPNRPGPAQDRSETLHTPSPSRL